MQLAFATRGRIGLSVLVASLAAIAVLLVLSFEYQQLITTKHVRAEGISLARLITTLPGTDEQRRIAWREIFQQQHRHEHFAYAQILDSEERPVVEVTSVGVLVPAAQLVETSGWVREAPRSQANAGFIEFIGPIRVGGETGSFRIGFVEPPFLVSVEYLPRFASLVLPVFLLVPLFLFFLRREVTPLAEVNKEMSTILPEDAAPYAGEQDLKTFAQQFNQFITVAKTQISQYEDETSKLVTSEKFLNYRVARFEEILNSIPDAVLVLDEEGSVTFANRQVETPLGVAHDDLVGRKLTECVGVESLRALLEKYAQNLSQLIGEPLEFALPDDEEAVFRLTFHALSEGPFTSHVVVIHDVAREARARRSRSEFVAHLAHELKAPLNTLAMYTEALQEGGDVDPEIQLEAANVISDEVERLARLINNLLSMTQIEMGTLELDRQRVKLVELVRDATEAMQRSARDRQLEFVLDLPSDVIPVHVDKDLLRVAINNLLTNAIKYTDAGGRITVSVTETDEAVSICVADTGIGIATADQEQIFNKFYRSDDASMEGRSGHGLGLPLALDIVNLHHGSIRVDSVVGAGSRFYIDLWKHTGVVQQAI